MSRIRDKVLSLFFITISFFSVGYGSPLPIDNQLGLTKTYVSHNNIFFQEGCMLIIDGQNVLCVKTLHQDSSGMYYYYASMYGRCPNGHPYTVDGGCLGYNCPYN